MKQNEERAYKEAQSANQTAANYREDLSFLNKEQARLTEELEYEKEQKLKTQDQLHKVELDYQNVLNSANDQSLRREVDSLRGLREIN